MRPAANIGGSYDWHWSGGFDIPDFEMYFGLRLRHASDRDRPRFLNIPVNVSVNNCGAVLLTFKNQRSLAPYRIKNHCKDLVVQIVQVCGCVGVGCGWAVGIMWQPTLAICTYMYIYTHTYMCPTVCTQQHSLLLLRFLVHGRTCTVVILLIMHGMSPSWTTGFVCGCVYTHATIADLLYMCNTVFVCRGCFACLFFACLVIPALCTLPCVSSLCISPLTKLPHR